MTVIEILKGGKEVILDNEADIEAFASEWERTAGINSAAKMRTAKKITLTPSAGGGMAFKYEYEQ